MGSDHNTVARRRYGLYEFGRYAEARSAYQKALQVNDKDVRARFNLAFVHIRERDYAAALAVIAAALALDKMGQYRDRLLHKQHEALALLAAQNQQEYLLLINLISRHTTAPSAARLNDSGDGAAPVTAAP